MNKERYMTITNILSNFQKHIDLTQGEKEHFTSFLIRRQLHKKEIILQQGEACNYLNFVDSGILRAYYLGKDGKESTVMFAVSDWWITAMPCFIREIPAMVNIEAVEKSCILQLSKTNLDQLYRDIPKFERFFRILMQNAYIREQLRIIQNLSQTAEERYYNFLTKYPQITPHLTQKQIASYLGITPEFLSMIRRKKG
mgnify:CR=1 FL=1